MTPRGVLGSCLVLALSAVPAGMAAGPSLPSEDCLRMLRQARIAGMKGDVSGELETLRAAVEAFPREIAPVYALIEHHRRHHQPEEGLQELRETLARRLQESERDLPAGVLARIVRDPDADDATLRLLAEHAGRRLAGRETRDPDLLGLLAALQERLGQVEAAVATLEELYRLRPSDLLEWTLYQHYLRLERWDDAIEVLGSLVDVERDELFRVPYIRLLGKAGHVEEHQRQIDLLLSDAEDLGADRIELLWRSAWDLRDGGHDAAAERELRRLLELNPEHQGAQAVLLHLYGTEKERLAFAAAEAERRQGETDPRTLFDEGTQLLMAGDAEAAVDLLRRAAPGLPDLEAAWYNLGMAAYRLEDWSAAESAFGRAAELNPERAESFFFRGIALATLDDRCADAVAPLERALELDPDRGLAHYHLARCYRVLGDADAAARHQRLYDATR